MSQSRDGGRDLMRARVTATMSPLSGKQNTVQGNAQAGCDNYMRIPLWGGGKGRAN